MNKSTNKSIATAKKISKSLVKSTFKKAQNIKSK